MKRGVRRIHVTKAGSLAILLLLSAFLLVLVPSPTHAVTAPSVDSVTVNSGGTSLSLPSQSELYIFGFVTGGGQPSNLFSDNGVNNAYVSNSAGNIVAGIVLTLADNNNFTTGSGYPSIGGAGISGFATYSFSSNSSSLPAASSVSDTVSVSTSGSLLVVFALGGDEQCLQVNGIPGFTVDASNSNTTGLPDAIVIGHATPPTGTYTATEYSQQCAGGQNPGYAADLIGVLVFAPGSPALVITPNTYSSAFESGNNWNFTSKFACPEVMAACEITNVRVTPSPSTPPSFSGNVALFGYTPGSCTTATSTLSGLQGATSEGCYDLSGELLESGLLAAKVDQIVTWVDAAGFAACQGAYVLGLQVGSHGQITVGEIYTAENSFTTIGAIEICQTIITGVLATGTPFVLLSPATTTSTSSGSSTLITSTSSTTGSGSFTSIGASSSSSSSSIRPSSSPSSSGGIPEFPFRAFIVVIFASVVAVAYLTIRLKTKGGAERGRGR